MTSRVEFDPDGPGAAGTLFGLPEVDDAAVRVLSVPFDATASYRRGAAEAPANVLEASSQVDLTDLETGDPWRAGIVMDPTPPLISELNQRARADVDALRNEGSPDEADLIRRVDDAGTRLNTLVEAWTVNVFAQDAIPGILGGDHSVPLGAIRAAAARYPGLGILQIDAHADLRVAYEGFAWSHASITHNILREATGLAHMVQVGVRDLGRAERARAEADRALTLWSDMRIADAMHRGTPWAEIVERMIAPLPENVWITFDIDGLDPSLCPTTGTPVPGGLSWRETLGLLSAIGKSRRIVGFDLCEVGPGDWDAIVGARLLYKLAGWAVSGR